MSKIEANKDSITTHSLGYPRIGGRRELKKATEAFWKGRLTLEELIATGKRLRALNWKKQQMTGIDLIPVNDFSFYDQVLDMSCLLGNLPPRFGINEKEIGVEAAFTVARGTQGGASLVEDEKDCQTGKVSTFASEMTKWFDTNYHYIVPELRADTEFSLSHLKVIEEFEEAKALGINGKPILIGPVTYLSLGKVQDSKNNDFEPLNLLEKLIPVYCEVITKLSDARAEWIQLDEPIFSTDLSEAQRYALKYAYSKLSCIENRSKILVATYFGGVRENLTDYLTLPVDGLHFDFIRGAEEFETVLDQFPRGKVLSAGVVDGRNVWKNDFDVTLELLRKAEIALGQDKLWIAPTCSLLHSPITLEDEPALDPELRGWLAFADEKLTEVYQLGEILKGRGSESLLMNNRLAIASRKSSSSIHSEHVKARLASVKPDDFERKSNFEIRREQQREKLNLPEFPTSTIGSFPQTKEVRQARAKWKRGELSDSAYDQFLKEETAKCVHFQDAIGIDMLVHGEFERNDMVEYFGENLEGFTFTENGWVQSFGTRCVKPPVIYGDVSRRGPITVHWSEYAQSLTTRPMKGMLTGPVTILQWSFVRDDQPRSVTAHQIALAIRDEVIDLEAAGIAAIQIDEPAFREGLPLRRIDWCGYLDWAVKAFRLSASGVKDTTQIHTHMCYSEFNDIIDSITEMDADVITIETSRSNMDLLGAFVEFDYPNEIGPGVYDIHSPRIPQVDEMMNLIVKAESVLPRRNLWINPDCGLKTRQWSEVKPSLSNMVEAAKLLRRS
ncbi:MAG: 5-methyltetrahydropteroyltriglutamate--homocysteine S-methyltransferase [Opitutales bacterium]